MDGKLETGRGEGKLEFPTVTHEGPRCDGALRLDRRKVGFWVCGHDESLKREICREGISNKVTLEDLDPH